MLLKNGVKIVAMLVVAVIFVGCTSSDDVQELPPVGDASSSSGGKGNNIASYKTVKIGNQTWMAENLDYAVEGSKCYNNQDSNCNTYGRLYNWATAMALPANCETTSCSSQISTKHRGICPSGWHIPSNAEWDQLYRYADGTSGTSSPYGSPTAGRYLKATSGWNEGGNGEDTHGFAALPGGYGYSDGSFSDVGNIDYWWSASEYNSDFAYRRFMYYNYERAIWNDYVKSRLHSVRCAQD
jgi:uncharacterized protein (TIGR02145 family)